MGMEVGVNVRIKRRKNNKTTKQVKEPEEETNTQRGSGTDHPIPIDGAIAIVWPKQTQNHQESES